MGRIRRSRKHDVRLLDGYHAHDLDDARLEGPGTSTFMYDLVTIFGVNTAQEKWDR